MRGDNLPLVGLRKSNSKRKEAQYIHITDRKIGTENANEIEEVMTKVDFDFCHIFKHLAPRHKLTRS